MRRAGSKDDAKPPDRIAEERLRLTGLMGYPICGFLMGIRVGGTPRLCRMAKRHVGPHV